jgi:RNA polymerase sigma-70 factor (ECF subfamily)
LAKLRDPVEQPLAWARFVSLYVPLLYRQARRLGVNPDDAGDLVQDVLVVLLRALPDFHYDPQRSFRAWLKTVVQNRWRETLRRPRLATALPEVLEQLTQDDALQELTESEHTRHLVQVVLPSLAKHFPPAEWTAFERYALQGQPATTVAADLGISVATVYAARSRVLRRIRDELGEFLD